MVFPFWIWPSLEACVGCGAADGGLGWWLSNARVSNLGRRTTLTYFVGGCGLYGICSPLLLGWQRNANAAVVIGDSVGKH